MTLEESIAQWKTENPPPITVNENGVIRQITTAEYELMAADMGQLLFEASQQQETHTADIDEIAALTSQVGVFRARADDIDSRNIPAAEFQHDVAELYRILADTICVLNKHSREPQPIEGDLPVEAPSPPLVPL